MERAKSLLLAELPQQQEQEEEQPQEQEQKVPATTSSLMHESMKLPSAPERQRRARTGFDDDDDYKLDELPTKIMMDINKQLTIKHFDPGNTTMRGPTRTDCAA